jgi:hypothetical protein
VSVSDKLWVMVIGRSLLDLEQNVGLLVIPALFIHYDDLICKKIHELDVMQPLGLVCVACMFVWPRTFLLLHPLV